MNIKKLVQLAQNDDILLAKYSRRWATGNPVCTALFVYKARLFGWPLVVFCAVLSMIGSAQRIDILASIPAGMIISTLMIALTERRRYKDMIAFCETITRLEKKSCAFGTSVAFADWQDEHSIARVGEGLLKMEAREVSRLQQISWRKSEAEERREQLEKNIGLMFRIAPVAQEVGHYFKS
ncbi:MAG TPA: hypothetical protein VFQ72_02825 [Candidatus Paceibacterota bacterium]|nr:hypothetical protein [Candidatus Paceibacterota bacterium]